MNIFNDTLPRTHLSRIFVDPPTKNSSENQQTTFEKYRLGMISDRNIGKNETVGSILPEKKKK